MLNIRDTFQVTVKFNHGAIVLEVKVLEDF